MTFQTLAAAFEQSGAGTDDFKRLYKDAFDLMKSDRANAALYFVIGVAAHVIVGWLVLRRRHDLTDRLPLANGNAIVGLGLTMVPAGLTWAFFPPPYVEVPGPSLLVLLPAVQVALG